MEIRGVRPLDIIFGSMRPQVLVRDDQFANESNLFGHILQGLVKVGQIKSLRMRFVLYCVLLNNHLKAKPTKKPAAKIEQMCHAMQ